MRRTQNSKQHFDPASKAEYRSKVVYRSRVKPFEPKVCGPDLVAELFHSRFQTFSNGEIVNDSSFRTRASKGCGPNLVAGRIMNRSLSIENLVAGVCSSFRRDEDVGLFTFPNFKLRCPIQRSTADEQIIRWKIPLSECRMLSIPPRLLSQVRTYEPTCTKESNHRPLCKGVTKFCGKRPDRRCQLHSEPIIPSQQESRYSVII